MDCLNPPGRFQQNNPVSKAQVEGVLIISTGIWGYIAAHLNRAKELSHGAPAASLRPASEHRCPVSSEFVVCVLWDLSVSSASSKGSRCLRL